MKNKTLTLLVLIFTMSFFSPVQAFASHLGRFLNCANESNSFKLGTGGTCSGGCVTLYAGYSQSGSYSFDTACLYWDYGCNSGKVAYTWYPISSDFQFTWVDSSSCPGFRSDYVAKSSGLDPTYLFLSEFLAEIECYGCFQSDWGVNNMDLIKNKALLFRKTGKRFRSMGGYEEKNK